MARRTASSSAWNLPPIRARSPFHLCQYAGEVVGRRFSTHASRTRGSEMAWARAMPASSASSTPEGEQVIALVLQRDPHRADASRVLGLAGFQLRDDEVEQLSPRRQVRAGQGQDVVAQPMD